MPIADDIEDYRKMVVSWGKQPEDAVRVLFLPEAALAPTGFANHKPHGRSADQFFCTCGDCYLNVAAPAGSPEAAELAELFDSGRIKYTLEVALDRHRNQMRAEFEAWLACQTGPTLFDLFETT